ncbi:glycoside hydrolase family 2 protein [Kiritimatiellaeota bacterium B1221]|nr:glycoside hydrolase family 2 protein [Kiritimatiellaeota bacterium B1221]
MMNKNETLSLNGIWQLTREKNQETIPATVPGNVHQALLAADLIPDPYYRENERDLQWIGQEAWSYRRTFELSEEQVSADGITLVCKGLDTFARLEINGEKVAETDNMFREWSFDVGALLKVGENTIVVSFQSVFPYIEENLKVHDVRTPLCIEHEPRGRSYIRKEQCNFGWDWGPVLVTHGIWRDLELQIGSESRVQGLQLRQTHSAGCVKLLGELALSSEVQADVEMSVEVSLEGRIVAGHRQTGDVTFEIEIQDPKLWWPNNMGDATLYDVKVTLETASPQSICRRVGFRVVELVQDEDAWGRSFYFRINGVPMFAKGSNWIPADSLHRVTNAHYRDLLQSAADGNQNMIRVWGGGFYEEDVFYDICDELGLLVWQDFMFACSAYPADTPGFKESVEAEVIDQAKRLASHACIALWCGNNELEQMAVGFEGQSWPLMPLELYKQLFDEWIPDALATVVPDAIYWPSSAHSPAGDRKFHANPECGDAHLWDVWHRDRPFEWYRGSFHRFCSEFGFQSYPEMKTLESITEPRDRNITSPVMEFHQRSGIGNSKIMNYMLSWFRMPEGFESTVMLSQLQQGLAIKYALEHWRLNRPRCMGALYWQLNDCWPVASWASIDYYGRWKTLHYMSKRFFAPLLVAGVEHPEEGRVDVHVASDLNEKKTLTLKCIVTDIGGEVLRSEDREIDVNALESRKVTEMDCSQFLETSGPRNLLVWLELWDGDDVVSENLVYFVKPKHLELNVPEVRSSVRAVDDSTFEVSLEANLPALWVTLQLKKLDFRADDNALSLRPGEVRKVTVRTLEPVSTDVFSENLRLTSITDYSNYQ